MLRWMRPKETGPDWHVEVIRAPEYSTFYDFRVINPDGECVHSERKQRTEKRDRKRHANLLLASYKPGSSRVKREGVEVYR